MAYATLYRMKSSVGLTRRLTACAAQEDIPSPESWVALHIWSLIKGSDWVDSWQYAEDTMTSNHNPDVGARNDVINDGMILSSVQAVRVANPE